MFGFFDKRCREEKFRARIAERDQRIRQLKDRVSTAKVERDKARARSAELSRQLSEARALLSAERVTLSEERVLLSAERVLRGNAEARVARLIDDLILSEAHPLPAELNWPLPPVRLRARVAGSWAGHAFLRMGGVLSSDVRTVLDLAGEDRSRFQQVLDWGCGCGRVMREFPQMFPNATLTGADIDAEAIAWNQEHLRGLGEFCVVPSVPPSSLPAGRFDLILGVSVFTHLPLALESAWLRELARIAAPGARLLLSYHGDELIREHFTMDQAIENEDGFSYFRTSPTEGLPDHYQASFHTEGALRRLWGEHFDILSIHPLSLGKRQGMVLCRARE